MAFVRVTQYVSQDSTIAKLIELIVGLITVVIDKVGRAGATTETMTIFDSSPLHRHPRKICEQRFMSVEGAVGPTCTIRRATEVYKNICVTKVSTLTRNGWDKEQR